jgi:hypothetical protein
MNFAAPRRIGCTFRIRQKSKIWEVSRDEVLYGDFLTRGEAVRAACFGARTQDSHGRPAQVVASPGDELIPHNEPHFGA